VFKCLNAGIVTWMHTHTHTHTHNTHTHTHTGMLAHLYNNCAHMYTHPFARHVLYANIFVHTGRPWRLCSSWGRTPGWRASPASERSNPSIAAGEAASMELRVCMRVWGRGERGAYVHICMCMRVLGECMCVCFCVCGFACGFKGLVDTPFFPYPS
jgi:hypothetical protein